jgi:hypothetical protein
MLIELPERKNIAELSEFIIQGDKFPSQFFFTARFA